MTGVWAIVARLENVAGQRIIIYEMDFADTHAAYNLGDINYVCRDACRELLEKTEDQRDKGYIQKEMEFLSSTEKVWRTDYKKW